ncbi:AMP-binding protein, partial [Isoalcanivorax beigongshangi]
MMIPSYTRGDQTPPLLAMTIGAALERAVAQFGDQEALVVAHQNLRYSWRSLSEAVDECARALLALGLERGDRLGIWAPNCAEWCIVQFATARIGVILVNINPAYRVGELEYALRQSGCAWVVCADRFKQSDYHAMLQQLAPELADATPGQAQCAALPELRGVISLCEQPPRGMLAWRQLAALAAQVPAQQLLDISPTLQFDDPINIQYTSGTTGFPKGATLSHYNILNNGYMVGASQRLGPDDRVVIPVPLYHCFGMVMGNLACVAHGATMIYPAPSFEPEATLRAVER